MPVQIPLDIPGLRDLTKSMKELRAETALARREVQGLGGDVTSSSHRITSGTLERITRTAGTPPANATEARTRGGRASRVYDIPSGANQRTTEARRRLEQAIETGDQDLIEDARANLRRQQIAQRRQRELLDPPHRRVRGANSRYQDAEEALQRARRRGDKSEIADAEANLERMRRARDRQEAMRDPTKRRELAIMDAIATSRIGPLGQLYPLVNKLKSAGLSRDDLQAKMADMGMSEAQIARLMPAAARLAAGVVPMVVAGAGAAVGIGAAISLGMSTHSYLSRGSSAYWTAGGSSRTIGQMMGIGGANAAGNAVALGDQLRAGTYGAGYMRSRGVLDLGPYTVDKAKNFVRALDELAKIKDPTQQLRVLRDLPALQERAWVLDLNDQQRERMKQMHGEMGSPRQRRSAAEFNMAKEEFSVELDKLKSGPGKYALDATTGWMMYINTGWMMYINTFAKGLSDVVNPDYWSTLFTNPKAFFDPDQKWRNSVSSQKSEEEAPDRPSSTYRPIGDGPSYVGGGRRTRGALPPGIAMQYLDDSFTYQSVNLGAFGVD